MCSCTGISTASGVRPVLQNITARAAISLCFYKELLLIVPNARRVVSLSHTCILRVVKEPFLVEARVARSARAIRVGTLRPAIVLYDETHPLGDDIGAIQSADVARKPDLLIVMGTSLKVHGLRRMVKEFAKTVHAYKSSVSSNTKPWQGKVIFVNKTPPATEWNDIIDYHVEGDTDSWVEKVIEDWKKMRPADWEAQQTLVSVDGNVSMSGGFKTVKDISTPKAKGKGKG